MKGCDHIKCRCGYEFCFHCGGIYNNCECTKTFAQRRGKDITNVVHGFNNLLHKFTK